MKYILLIIAIICIVHIYRDYLLEKGVKNRFTTFWKWHILKEPIYNRIGMVILGVVATICLYFFFKY